MKIILGDFNEKVGIENIFSRQSGIRVHIRIVRVMVSD
jgi:hypothetical protein